MYGLSENNPRSAELHTSACSPIFWTAAKVCGSSSSNAPSPRARCALSRIIRASEGRPLRAFRGPGNAAVVSRSSRVLYESKCIRKPMHELFFRIGVHDCVLTGGVSPIVGTAAINTTTWYHHPNWNRVVKSSEFRSLHEILHGMPRMGRHGYPACHIVV